MGVVLGGRYLSEEVEDILDPELSRRLPVVRTEEEQSGDGGSCTDIDVGPYPGKDVGGPSWVEVVIFNVFDFEKLIYFEDIPNSESLISEVVLMAQIRMQECILMTLPEILFL